MVKLTVDRGKSLKTVSYFSVYISLGLIGVSLGPTLTALAQKLEVNLNAISILFSARAVGMLIGSILGGRLYDRFRGHPILSLGLFVATLLLSTVPLINLLWLMILTMVLLGSMEGILHVGSNTLIMWVHRKNAPPYLNTMHFLFGLGALLSPMIIAQILFWTGDRLFAYWILGIILIPIAVGIFLLPSPSILVSKVEEQKNNGLSFPLSLLTIFFLFYAGAEMSYGGWVYTYVVSRGMATSINAAYLTTGFYSFFALGRLFSIPLSAKIRPSIILLGDLIGALISMLVIIISKDSFVTLWIGTCSLGLFLASVFPTAITLGDRHISVSGKATGWFMTGTSIGAMSLPWVIGQFFEMIGPIVVMLIISIDLFIALLVLITLFLVTNRLKNSQS